MSTSALSAVIPTSLTKVNSKSNLSVPTRSEYGFILNFIPLAMKLDGKNASKSNSISNQLTRALAGRLPTGTNIFNAASDLQISDGLLPSDTQTNTDISLFKKWGHPSKHLPQFKDEELHRILAFIPIARELDGDKVYDVNSITNQIYRILYPREKGINAYGGALKGDGAEEYLKQARQFSRELAEAGYYMVTGGGHSFMESIALGALDANSHTMGSNLWRFNDSDPKVHHEITMFHGVPARIGAEGGYEHRAAYTLVFPGGIGTNREVYSKLEDLLYSVTPYPSHPTIPIVDINPIFTQEIRGALEQMVKDGRVKPKVFDIVKFIKTPKEVLDLYSDPKYVMTPGRKLDKVKI